MKRLIAYVSGNVQQVGYRAKVIEIARAFGLKGMVENLEDGRVHIIADGEDKKLEWFEDAINIKNTLIQVTSIKKEYSVADGLFNNFGKLVFMGETDSRLDKGVVVMKDILVGVHAINNNLTNMNSDIKNINNTLIDMNSNLGSKMDQIKEDTSAMLEKQGAMLEKQGAMLEKQDTTISVLKEVKEDTGLAIGILEEVKEDTTAIKADISGLRKDASESLYEKYEELCREIAEIKATLSEIKAKAV